jgi:hypothetical protein
MTQASHQSIRVPAARLIEFCPQGLGMYSPRLRGLFDRFSGLRQREILALIDAERKVLATRDLEATAYEATLLVLSDYILTGYYPVSQGGREYMVPLWDAGNQAGGEQHKALRMIYERLRERDSVTEAGVRRLSSGLDAVRAGGYDHAAILRLFQAGKFQPTLRAVSGNRDRALWTAVRSTWSMVPDRSAPGREVSMLLRDQRYPDTPVGILQYRNVVPGIKSRDHWLGLAIPASGQGGYFAAISDSGDPVQAIDATRSTLERLLRSINGDGVITPLEPGRSGALKDEGEGHRRLYHLKKQESGSEARRHLAIAKRALTAGDLLTGIEGFSEVLDSPDPVAALRAPALARRCETGLRKIWHYHMGFVAIELSICGAAPPFGALRIGKLVASLAASREALDEWGRDRPLGQIAQTTFMPSVRDDVPNPGPLALFTSGLYPGHSAQYNRLVTGGHRWVKYGESSGWGGFTISQETLEALTHYNHLQDGYRHVTHTFGEGASARMREIGQALGRLNLPDIRQHNVRRPLYALSLVDDIPGALFGWAPVSKAIPQTVDEIFAGWQERWLGSQLDRLVVESSTAPSLEEALSAQLSRAHRVRPVQGTLPL